MSRTSSAGATTLAQLGERGFHAWLRRGLDATDRGALGLGDDCASLPGPGGSRLLLTTDALLEGTHFPGGAPAPLVGSFAAEVNLSDLAAKGARPRALLVTLLLPPRTPVAWAQGVMRAIDRAGRRAGAPVVGGDTKASLQRGLVLTAVGTADPRRQMPLGAARAGDLLAVTGTVGRGGAAYLRWHRGGAQAPRALRNLLGVRARLAEGLALAPYAHATTDTSDGLVVGIERISGASRLAPRLVHEMIPWHAGLRAAPRPEETGFLGGDYELLSAVPVARIAAAQRAVARCGGRLTVVGRLLAQGVPVYRKGGEDRPWPSGGWDAFRR